jgi:hypothetical protein
LHIHGLELSERQPDARLQRRRRRRKRRRLEEKEEVKFMKER